jgi:two-component system sensor histidine kinase DesK
VTETQPAAHRVWFGLFGAHGDPRSRLLCVATALLFLAFPFSDLLGGRLSPASQIAAGAGLAAFTALYLRLFWILPSVVRVRRREGIALLVGLSVLAIALSLAFGDDWSALLVYLSVALALALPTRPALAAIAAVATAAAAVGGEIDTVVQVVTFGGLLVAVRRLMELVRELDATRSRIAALAVSEERLRLSRDLHDLLGHNLSLITLKSQLARKLLASDPSAVDREVRDIETVARCSLRETRAALRGLRDTSLQAEIDAARDILEAAGIRVAVRREGSPPDGFTAPLAFVVREATTNVLRHSRARHCEIVVRRSDGVAEIEVRDDGVGSPASSHEGSGLRGLGERLAQAGGTLDAGPTPTGGFHVHARVPQPRREAAVAPSEAVGFA